MRYGSSQARDAFYRRIVWVVDGTRLKRDKEKFIEAWGGSTALIETPLVHVRRLRLADFALLREWSDSRAPVFLDFCDGKVRGLLILGRLTGSIYVAQILRAAFIQIHRASVSQSGPDFDELVTELNGLVASYEVQLQAQASSRSSPNVLHGFQQYLTRGARRRRRF